MPEAARRSMYVVQDEFNEAWSKAREEGWSETIPCNDNPGPYVDWTTPPTAEEAEALCDGCEFYNLCRELGDVTKPSWGIYGGKVWLYKRSIYGIGSPGIPVDSPDELDLENAA